ncbi:sigma-54 interaction domain-containing protein [Pedobacter miscanthi]|uniref:sigma-54 interaction domain-containing protein n=1 Tax=Pedobacter miscanthi TaxID=2259170 RepID=UPI001ABF8F71|nr:sigma-54 dependent transcriptional regulator [Pedobacter miscanthi]
MPQGFLVKPFREKDVLVMLDVAWYLFEQKGVSDLNVKKPVKEILVKNFLGKSPKINEVLKQVGLVANSDISVLILGESGTGKELIAKEIHSNSSRKKNPFIVVNCSALPEHLVESELFGHEKGAFTGATTKRTGKFEQADTGTIFLDEIGELSLEMQVKFLRVLQEREIEPIGGRTRKIDVRIIAATNRDLAEEAAAGNFRIDLFYRLNVFPIELPPLSARREDIPLLSEHFVRHFAKEANKSFNGISPEALAVLTGYHWPGNVRELENIIFRSILLNDGPELKKIYLPAETRGHTETRMKTIQENERDHIIAVLEQCNWKIYGSGGAAEVLDINISTLNSRIKKLGIKKP